MLRMFRFGSNSYMVGVCSVGLVVGLSIRVSSEGSVSIISFIVKMSMELSWMCWCSMK